MLRFRIIASTVIVLLVGGGAASAQESGHVGLSMGYPEKIGVLWHVTERVAIRPGISLSNTSSDPEFSFGLSGGPTSTRTTSSNDASSIGVQVDALFSVGVWDNVHAYIAPGYEYGRSTFRSVMTTVSTGPLGSSTTSETQKTHGHDHEVRGIFGARYVPHRRFGVFGEMGLHYSKSESAFFESILRQRSWGTTTGVGVIFYF